MNLIDMRRYFEITQAIEKECAMPLKPDLEAIRKRAEAATPGPWEHLPGSDTTKDVVKTGTGMWAEIGFAPKTAAFIAHARTDIPQLLAYIEKLEKVVSAVKECRAVDAIHLAKDGAAVEDLTCFDRLENALRDLGEAKNET